MNITSSKDIEITPGQLYPIRFISPPPHSQGLNSGVPGMSGQIQYQAAVSVCDGGFGGKL